MTDDGKKWTMGKVGPPMPNLKVEFALREIMRFN
jgi:hypothetical protein